MDLIFREYDADQTGTLDFNEFKQFMITRLTYQVSLLDLWHLSPCFGRIRGLWLRRFPGLYCFSESLNNLGNRYFILL